MDPAESISRIGFQRWYERQLYEGHAWLATCFLSLFAALALLEQLTARGSAVRMLTLAVLAYGAGSVCIYGFIRYRRTMERAERYGERAACPQCAAKGQFEVVGKPLRVRCSKCAHEWRID